jgi:hypothetical protein
MSGIACRMGRHPQPCAVLALGFLPSETTRPLRAVMDPIARVGLPSLSGIPEDAAAHAPLAATRSRAPCRETEAWTP